MSKHYKRAILLLVILAVTFSANTLFAAARRRVPVKPRMQNSHKIEQLRREADRGHVGSRLRASLNVPTLATSRLNLRSVSSRVSPSLRVTVVKLHSLPSGFSVQSES